MLQGIIETCLGFRDPALSGLGNRVQGFRDPALATQDLGNTVSFEDLRALLGPLYGAST